MSKYQLVLILLTTNLLLLAANADDTAREGLQRIPEEKQREQRQQDLTPQDVAIDFHGKVLDQRGDPVEGVDIVLHVGQFAPDARKGFQKVKEVQARTDAQGLFRVSQERGIGIYVQDMHREGYEFSWEQNPNRSYQYSGPRQRPSAPDRNSPVVFHMRKKGAMTFLLTHSPDFHVLPENSGKTIACDFIQYELIREGDKSIRPGPPLARDLAVKATFNEEDGSWTATVSGGTSKDGVIFSDQLLYEAPEAGYQSEYILKTNPRKALTGKHIYVRSRDPAIYTRIDVSGIIGDRAGFSLAGRAVTNPYGERNLEQATDLPSAVADKLIRDAQAAFSQGKRPSKVDLPKLVREAKDKGEQTGAKRRYWGQPE